MPDATAQPAPGIRTYVDGERLALFFTRDPTHNDVTIEVQAAGDVTGPWTTVATSVNGAPTSGPGYFGGETPGASLKTIEARDIVNVDATPQRFLRIRLSH